MQVSTATPRKDLFGDVAVAKGFLTWAQMREALKRQQKYKEMGIPIRIGEVSVEMGLLTQTQCNEILADQKERRKAYAEPAKAAAVDPQANQEIDDGVPFHLGRFRIQKRLGGVMGIVYRALDTKTNVAIALKILPKTLAHEPAFVERFKREVKATSALSHPNIVKIIDAGVEHGLFYLAMEYIDGESLNQRLRRVGKLEEREALVLGRSVALALQHAHSLNVLHRDIKPENIMLTQAGDVKLTDFGLAKLVADETKITADGIAVGTPHYIAPEQARALKETDHRADLYALGATLFHCLTGRLPYEGDDGAEIMRRHVFEACPDPRSVDPQMTPSVADMLMKLMAKDPNQRYQSGEELAQFLDTVVGPRTSDGQAGQPAPQRLNAMPRKRFTLE
jgi:eukaryotic-like serine/threonine-protein kinase